MQTTKTVKQVRRYVPNVKLRPPLRRPSPRGGRKGIRHDMADLEYVDGVVFRAIPSSRFTIDQGFRQLPRRRLRIVEPAIMRATDHKGEMAGIQLNMGHAAPFGLLSPQAIGCCRRISAYTAFAKALTL